MADQTKQLFDSDTSEPQGPVECLGMTFENDAARREHFLQLLRAQLQDPEFRKIEGFPIGEDDDILALSDPPYYTACPNPFVRDFNAAYGSEYDQENNDYHRKPMAVDVSVGKTDSLYTAHSYHTKVPHKAIMRAILHYTNPGDIVLDGFSGSGMVGVAAQVCGSAKKDIKQEINEEWSAQGDEGPMWGARRAVLTDLSPAATFISANYNTPFDRKAFASAARNILDQLRTEVGWMYETTIPETGESAPVNFTVWSEAFSCPECASEVIFTREAFDADTKKVRKHFNCPQCQTRLTKGLLERQFETQIDPATGEPWSRVKFVPVTVNYSVGKERREKDWDATDSELFERIAQLGHPPAVPTAEFPLEQMYHGSRLAPKGFTNIHHLFLARATQSFGRLWEICTEIADPRTRNMLLFMIDQSIWGASILNRYSPSHFSQVNRQLTGVYYVPSQHAECSPWYMFEGKLKRLKSAFDIEYARYGQAIVSTNSTTSLQVPDNSIDYVFTDPPFGANIPYADLNVLVESWHGVLTNPVSEAIMDQMKNKGLPEYQRLMQKCFEEYQRVLKPGRWMTMVFHNSHNAVWNCIQEAMSAAGFVVADVRTLDKQQGSYRQVTSTAVKQDLVVSAYKPNGGLEQRFGISAGSEEGVWQFIETHLRQLPVFVSKAGKAETIAERQGYLLYDRVVAFHVQRSVKIPFVNNAEFHAQIAQKYPQRDGMYFLPDQVAEYDRKRMTVNEVEQLDLFVTNEASAIQWLRQALKSKPQTFQELQPQFMQEVAGWQKHEKSLELSELLDQNFLCYDMNDTVPSQIHGYLSSNFKDVRKLSKDDPKLKAKAKDRWYVPDPRKEIDLEKSRHRDLMKEFNLYREAKGKLKTVRTEALRAGFKECWQQNDYAAIVEMAGRVREEIIQEDTALLMYYDNALMLSGE